MRLTLGTRRCPDVRRRDRSGAPVRTSREVRALRFGPMPTIWLTTRIRGSAEDTFEAITDLRGYGRWLDLSADYPGTVDITQGPVQAGTEYTERSRLGVRRGVITALRAPEHVVFHQPMTLRPRL